MTVIRHTALFVWADGITGEEKARVKEGVAYCYYGSTVLTLDFGEDLGLARTRHGFGLQHDHSDRADWDAYDENGAHARAGAFLKSVSQPELAARVDWAYDGPPLRRGAVRHLALYRWDAAAGETARAEAQAAMAGLRGVCPTVRAIEIGDDLRWYPTNFDWIVEAHFDDVDGLRAFDAHPVRLEAEAVVARATRNDRTQIQQRMLSG